MTPQMLHPAHANAVLTNLDSFKNQHELMKRPVNLMQLFKKSKRKLKMIIFIILKGKCKFPTDILLKNLCLLPKSQPKN